MEVVAGRGEVHAVHRVDRRVRGRRRRRRPALLDHRGAALLHGLDERALEPRGVGDDLRHRGAVDAGVGEVGELGGGVVAPDGDVADLTREHAGLLGQLRLGPVLVEPGHREPAVGGHVGRVRPGDEAVGVARVADHEHAHVAGRVVVDGLTLGLEDAAVDREQVAALHARLARDRADEQGPRRAVERGLQIGGGLDADEQRVGAVLQLHHHAFQRGQRGLDLQEAQHDRLVGTEQLTGRDAVDERVADLARGAGDGDVEGVRCHATEITRPPPIQRHPRGSPTGCR